MLLRIHSLYVLCSISSCVAAVLAGVYISVPYSLTKIRAFCLAFIQALVICYMKLAALKEETIVSADDMVIAVVQGTDTVTSVG